MCDNLCSWYAFTRPFKRFGNWICDCVMGCIWPDIGLVYETSDGKRIRYGGSHAAYDGALAAKMIRADTRAPDVYGTFDFSIMEPIAVPVRAPSSDFSLFVNGISTMIQDMVRDTVHDTVRDRPMTVCVVVSTRYTANTDREGNYIKVPLIDIEPTMSLNDIRIAIRTAIHEARNTEEHHLTIGDLAKAVLTAEYTFDSWTSLYRITRDDGTVLRLIGSNTDTAEGITTYEAVTARTHKRNFVICGTENETFNILRCISK